MQIIGRGDSYRSAYKDAEAKATEHGLVILSMGQQIYDGYDDEYVVECTAVEPGWLKRDAENALARMRRWVQPPPRQR